MTIDRAITLPHEFDKREEDPPVGGHGNDIVEVLRSPTKNTIERSQESDEHAQETMTEKS